MGCYDISYDDVHRRRADQVSQFIHKTYLRKSNPEPFYEL